MMFFVWGSYSVRMQQLERKLHGCHPEKQFAFRSTTCTVCTTLTYLLEEHELAPEISSWWNLASADRQTKTAIINSLCQYRQSSDQKLLVDKNFPKKACHCVLISYQNSHLVRTNKPVRTDAGYKLSSKQSFLLCENSFFKSKSSGRFSKLHHGLWAIMSLTGQWKTCSVWWSLTNPLRNDLPFQLFLAYLSGRFGNSNLSTGKPSKREEAPMFWCFSAWCNRSNTYRNYTQWQKQRLRKKISLHLVISCW